MRKELIEFLTKHPAHVSVKQSLQNLKPENRHIKVKHFDHTIWEIFEHMRIAQEDILQYTLNPGWKSPSWPDNYWPSPHAKFSEEIWQKTYSGFYADLQKTVDLVNDVNLDLNAEIPHGEGRTYLREVLLIIDHNAYHTGQVIQIRKKLSDWNT